MRPRAKRVATGERAVFDDKAKTVTLTGNPVMRQGNNQVSGAKVVYFIEQDRAMVEGDGKDQGLGDDFPRRVEGPGARGCQAEMSVLKAVSVAKVVQWPAGRQWSQLGGQRRRSRRLAGSQRRR